MANAAEVASHMVSPTRLSSIQSTSGTQTPAVVPFQLKTMSLVKFLFNKLGNLP